MPSPPPKKIEGFPYGWIWRARSSGWRAIAEALVSVDGGADKEDKVAARRPTPEPFEQRRIGSCSNTGRAIMHLHTYRDESHCRHFDLISEGKRPRTIDLVSAVMSGMLVMGFACALTLMVSFASTVPRLSAWVH
jgi:hypothetical protein